MSVKDDPFPAGRRLNLYATSRIHWMMPHCDNGSSGCEYLVSLTSLAVQHHGNGAHRPGDA